MTNDLRKKWMEQALRLAKKGGGRVAPNPPVGAVLVKEAVMIGQGYHQVFGGPHAEINALADCNNPAGASLFVTLEPCCHTGKTKPCTEAIVKAGIRHVIVGCLDENPLVAGKGIKWLREQGVRVELGCCEKEAKRLVSGFFKWQRTKQPRVILKWAQSLDGKLAWPADSDRRWISNEKSREHVQTLRQQCGAILVGIETVLADGPKLSVRLPGATFQPLRVVLDSRLRIPIKCHLVQTAKEQPVSVFTCSQNAEKAERLKQLGCEIIGVQSHAIELPDVLTFIGDRGITDLLIEGGAKIIDAFLNQKLADEVKVYIAPTTIGQSASLPKISVPGWDRPEAIRTRLDNPREQHFDHDILIKGVITSGC